MRGKEKLTEQGEVRFYEWLENKIAEEGSARAFCEIVGMAEGDVSKLRKGIKVPTVYTAEKFASAFNLQLKDVIGRDGTSGELKPEATKTKEKDGWETILTGQIGVIDADIEKLEKGIRQLKTKKAHFEEVLAIYQDWRSDNAD